MTVTEGKWEEQSKSKKRAVEGTESSRRDEIGDLVGFTWKWSNDVLCAFLQPSRATLYSINYNHFLALNLLDCSKGDRGASDPLLKQLRRRGCGELHRRASLND
jgi:hypothetical protein